METGGQVLLSDRVQPLHFWVGLQNRIFSLGCLLFSQTKLIPVSYYHFSMNGFGMETWGRVSKMFSWGVFWRLTGPSYMQGVCALASWEGRQSQGGSTFLVAQPASFLTWCPWREKSCQYPNSAQHLGPSPGTSAALNVPEKTSMLQSHLLRISRDNQGWILIEHIWQWRIQRHKATWQAHLKYIRKKPKLLQNHCR